MLAKAWIAVLMGLLLGSLFFSGGCGWFRGGYSNSPYYGGPCSCGAVHPAGIPAGGVPAEGAVGGWRSVPAAGGAANDGAPAATP